MIHKKTGKEIALMSQGGALLHQVFEKCCRQIEVGVTTNEIDVNIEKTILSLGGKPAFKRVPGYKWTTCICINEQVVHTPPTKRTVKEGDVVTVDAGVYYEGFNTDKADTFVIGKSTPLVTNFLKVGKKALKCAIEKTLSGNRIGDISMEIQKKVEGAGFWVIRELTGHGVGKKLHEDPLIPGYRDGAIAKTPLIVPGMCLAIEVIYATEKTDIADEPGQEWSLVTQNGSLSACFEDTVAVTTNRTLILT